jgi:hypothetical protein
LLCQSVGATRPEGASYLTILTGRPYLIIKLQQVTAPSAFASSETSTATTL